MKEMNTGGSSTPGGELSAVRVRDLGVLDSPPGWWTLKNWLQYRRRDVPRQFAQKTLGRLIGLVPTESALYGQVYRADLKHLNTDQLVKLKDLLAANHPVYDLPRFFGGEVVNYGLLSTRVVTTVGVNFLVDAFQNLVELENLKFHGYGTGGAAEAAANTALTTELTTQYATDNVRPTGTTTEGASANIYRTVATLSPDASVAITEHGIFDQAAVGGGVLWDRSLFSVINLVGSADSLQTTYDCTFPAGS